MSSSSPSQPAGPPGPAERPSKRSVSRQHRPVFRLPPTVQLVLVLCL